jgi:hypothetical protein
LYARQQRVDAGECGEYGKGILEQDWDVNKTTIFFIVNSPLEIYPFLPVLL